MVKEPSNRLSESPLDPPTMKPNGTPAVTSMLAVPCTSKPLEGEVQQFTGPALYTVVMFAPEKVWNRVVT